MSETINSAWRQLPVRDVVERHFCGPSPDCEERQIFHSDEWGVLKTTAVTWAGWDERAHKVLPKSFWNRTDIEIRAGDVLVTKAGPRHRVGVVCFVPSTRDRLIVSGKMIGLRANTEKVVPAVLAGLISQQSAQKYIHDRTTGMAESQLNFANEVLLDTPIKLPPLKEQLVIARIAGNLDTAIHETEAIIAKLKAVKQGLLHDLLTRGIDSNGELRPPQPEAPHLYRESPLGWIPKDWKIRAIREIGEVVTGNTPPSHDPLAWGLSVPFVTSGDIDESGAILKTERHISERGKRYVRLLPAGSSLVVCIGSVGKVGLASTTACTNQQINAVVPSSEIDRNFLFLALQKISNRLHVLAGLQVVPIVKKSSFESIEIAYPPIREQAEISLIFSALSGRLGVEEKLLQKLQCQKAGLMDDLFTGRVRVNSPIAAAAKGSA
jgi:type I restriction enzyme S subunit